jgi:hypothetical protein
MTITVADNYQALTGKGIEYMEVDGQVICEFFDGMIVRDTVPVDRDAETI